MKCKLVNNDELHESLAIAWHAAEIRRLNDILEENGLEDEKDRQEILTEFFFNQAVHLDGAIIGGSIEYEGLGYHPKLAFLTEEEKDGTPDLIAPTDSYDLHDYSQMFVAELFEDADERDEDDDEAEDDYEEEEEDD